MAVRSCILNGPQRVIHFLKLNQIYIINKSSAILKLKLSGNFGL